VDGRSLAGGSRGVAQYLTGMLQALESVDLRIALPPGAAVPDGVDAEIVRLRAPSRVVYGAAAASGRPRLDRILGDVDVVWLPAPAPVAVSRGAPVALTLHDLSFLERPGDFTRYERVWHRLARVGSLARRSRIIAVSGATAAAAREQLGVTSVVVPAGPGDPGPLDVRPRDGRYFLYVGALEPRKGVDRLVAAHAGIAEELVVAGEGRVPVAGRGVRVLGRVTRDEKAALYAGALAVVLPSWAEGYGYTPLEGFAHGTPAIVSDLPALRETAGAGAMYVPAGDVAALAAAMRELAGDEALRRRLAAGGAAALRARTWEASARALREALG
jgi:glycosyltransferase involved in cell wall biosynthesis